MCTPTSTAEQYQEPQKQVKKYYAANHSAAPSSTYWRPQFAAVGDTCGLSRETFCEVSVLFSFPAEISRALL